jgi:cell division protein FtsL
LVGNPNIGIKPTRRRGASGRAEVGVGSLRLPALSVLRPQGERRRRRAQLRLPQPPRLELPARMRFSTFGRAYLLLAGVVAVTLLYLVQAAGATQASYEIGRLQDQQQSLLAEQENLKYQEATSSSPAQVEAEAARADLTRPQPYKFVQLRDSGVALNSPPPAAPDEAPLWERALAAIGRGVTDGTDAMAAGK